MSRVVLAMSGGVDSSVAAHLLLRAGHEVIGVFMRHGEASTAACSLDGSTAASPLLPILQGRRDHKQGCCSASDADDARRVAARLGIPFYAIDLQREFGEIIRYFVDEYVSGRTPNPCVMCNHRLKFGRLFDYADAVGATYVATGHYARLESDPSEPAAQQLLRGVDTSKDQSYALFGIPRERLGRMLLPVGDRTKREIREIAASIGLNVAEKRDSQEICFVVSGEHDRFVRERTPGTDRSGEIVSVDGRVLGRHEGIEGFTIGQRRGLGVALGEPTYVVRIDAATRRVVVGPRAALGRTSLVAHDANWLAADLPEAFDCRVMVRYNSQLHAARVCRGESGTFEVTFVEPCEGVAPGQGVVCYDGDRVLGGGWIAETSGGLEPVAVASTGERSPRGAAGDESCS